MTKEECEMRQLKRKAEAAIEKTVQAAVQLLKERPAGPSYRFEIVRFAEAVKPYLDDLQPYGVGAAVLRTMENVIEAGFEFAQADLERHGSEMVQ